MGKPWQCQNRLKNLTQLDFELAGETSEKEQRPMWTRRKFQCSILLQCFFSLLFYVTVCYLLSGVRPRTGDNTKSDMIIFKKWIEYKGQLVFSTRCLIIPIVYLYCVKPVLLLFDHQYLIIFERRPKRH